MVITSSTAREMRCSDGKLSSCGRAFPLGYIQKYRAKQEKINRDSHARS